MMGKAKKIGIACVVIVIVVVVLVSGVIPLARLTGKASLALTDIGSGVSGPHKDNLGNIYITILRSKCK